MKEPITFASARMGWGMEGKGWGDKGWGGKGWGDGKGAWGPLAQTCDDFNTLRPGKSMKVPKV